MKQSSQRNLGYVLSQITRIWNQRFIDILRSQGYYNLKPSFCSVFFPLFDNDGQSASELARSTKITKQTMSIYVKELRQRGYIKIVQDISDKRIQRVFLTAKGSLLKAVFAAASTTISKEICKGLDASEADRLSLLLGKCLDREVLK